MNDSITIIDERFHYMELAANGQLRNKGIQKRLRKGWNNIPPFIEETPWTTLPAASPGGKWAPCVSIIIRKSRMATKHDSADPENVGYKVLKKQGAYLPPHDYLSEVIWSQPSWWNAGSVNSLTCALPNSGASVVDITGMIQEAQTKAINLFWANARHRVVANAALALVDLRSSIGMATSAVITITQVIMWLKRGRFDKAVEALIERGISIPSSARGRVRNYSQRSNITLQKWSSDAWLELQFGWKPLIQDVYNTLEHATDQMNGEYFPALTLRGRGPAIVRRSDYSSTVGTNTTTTITNYSCEVQSSITARFRVGTGNELLHAFGLDNPSSVLWDMIPFSFVVDWFLPIKRYLDNLSALNNLELIHCHQSLKVVENYHLKAVQTLSGGYDVETDIGRVYNSRTKISQIPPETFIIPNPGSLIDSWRFSTAFSLLEQRRSR